MLKDALMIDNWKYNPQCTTFSSSMITVVLYGPEKVIKCGCCIHMCVYIGINGSSTNLKAETDGAVACSLPN